jgi:hypothetical protein
VNQPSHIAVIASEWQRLQEAAMGSLNLRRKFDPLDLEIVDRVFEVACAYIETRNLYRDPAKDSDEEDVLRKLVFAVADNGPLDFDTLCDRVLASMDQYRSRAA